MPSKTPKPPPLDKASTWYCSFCLKSQHEVAKLVAGPARVSICDVCVGLASEWVAGREPDVSDYPAPEKLPTDRLLAQLPAIESHYRGQGAQLEWAVDLLRSRKVSWAAIGEKLGVSRQAAWERFS